MHRLLLAGLLSISSAAMAADRSAAHTGTLDLGFAGGGFTFAGTYEYLFNGQQGLGGTLRYYSRDDGHDGALIIGGMTGFHFFKGNWDFALSPSMNIINVSRRGKNSSSVTTLGPGISVGLTTALNDKVALGFGWNNYYAWFDEAVRGLVASSLDFRLKFSF